MNRTLASAFSVFLLLAGCDSSVPDGGQEKHSITDEENHLLRLILDRAPVDGRIAVVDPETRLVEDVAGDTRSYVAKGFRDSGYGIEPLVDRLFEVNRHPVRLTLESNAARGCVIDYEGTYTVRINECLKWPDSRENWHRLREDLNVEGMVDVSIPVYDETAGLVLVYKGELYGGLGGNGLIILYKYEEERLMLLARVSLWNF